MNKLTRYADIELRSMGESRDVEGLAVVFGQEADMGWYTEEIDPHALDSADLSDVVLNLNHNDDILLAGTRNGSLELLVREDGLFQHGTIVNTSQGEDVLRLVKSGLINKMSFSFVIDENEGEVWSNRNGKEHRVIRKIKRLFDVSLVTFPAYPQTLVYSRSMDKLAEEHKKLVERRAEQDRRLAEILKEK